ncbi:MAG: hypothetical protein IKX18_02835 [Muribaculaceae bacterium]|nr:hypothetical protein [Muribaculaceae bacterium]
MKKLLFIFTALMMASSAFAGHWVTFEAEDFDYTSGAFFVVKDGVTLEGYGRIDYDHFRFYANNSIAVSSDDGILKIEFTCIGEDDSQYGPGGLTFNWDGSRGQYSYDGYIGTWEDGITQEGEFVAFEEENFGEGPMAPFYNVSLYAEAQCRATKVRVYVLGDAPVTPPEPTERTGSPTFNGYTTDGIHAYFIEILPTEPSTIYYRIQFNDDEFSEWAEYEDVLSFTNDGHYRVEAYAVAPGKLESYPISYEFYVTPYTGLSELMNGKTVIGVRYFNLAGQEMPEANGMTIVVTTYTDGSTSAVKVMK